MFRIIVHYFGVLKHIPLVPHVYDALLKTHLFFFNRKLLDCLDDVEESVCHWDQVTVSTHKYGGTQFNVGKYELGHLHGNGLLDVLLNRKLKAEVMKHPAVQEHHIFKNSGWVSFWIKSPNDQDIAVFILLKAYAFRRTPVSHLTTP
jgi:hypothetical protein